jgi:hypothetical protein
MSRYGGRRKVDVAPSLTSKFWNIRLLNLGLISAVVLVEVGLSHAQLSGQKTFASPEEASQALFAAAQTGGQAALVDIFGPDGNEIIATGDSVQDQDGREQFIAKYKEMHRLAAEPDGTTTLYVGAYNWAFPVPLVYESRAWHFDTEAGEKEILYRRIGDNELAAIDICYELVSAEIEYYNRLPDGNKIHQYAQKIASDNGEHNGLFWKTADGEPESPIGPLLADALGVNYGQPQQGGSSPFHGYYYRTLTRQGKTAGGGAKSYIVKGEMILGFAFVAYPAQYRSSGVMTFIVNQSGMIYQKDLGPQTTDLAGAMSEYAPDETWRRADK